MISRLARRDRLTAIHAAGKRRADLRRPPRRSSLITRVTMGPACFRPTIVTDLQIAALGIGDLHHELLLVEEWLDLDPGDRISNLR
jgi:hypothetical protein